MSDSGAAMADQPTAAVETVAGTGEDGRSALADLLINLIAPSATGAAGETGEIAVPFRANGSSLAAVSAAAVEAVLEQQETLTLAVARVDLDGWLPTEDGIQAWGVLTGSADATTASPRRGDVVGTPSIAEGPAGVTITVRLGGADAPAAP